MKDEKSTQREDFDQKTNEIQGNSLSSENLDMSELEGVEGGNLDNVGCSAVFSGGCSGGSEHLTAQDR